MRYRYGRGEWSDGAFGEKYGKEVRVVSIPDFSIRYVVVLTLLRQEDRSILYYIGRTPPAGVRRIEALTKALVLYLGWKNDLKP